MEARESQHDNNAASQVVRDELPHVSCDSVGDAVAYMKLIARTYGWSVNEQDSRRQLTREFTLNHTGRIIAVRVTALPGQRNDGTFDNRLVIRARRRGSREHFESRLWKATQKQRMAVYLPPFPRSHRLHFPQNKKHRAGA